MRYGYARVSTKDQNLDLQTEALKQAHVDKIITEKGSAIKERPHLESLIKKLKEGDTLIVWKLDRLARSLKELIKMIDEFNKSNIHFISLQEGINTTTAQGRLFFHITAAFAEFERSLISERTIAGLRVARLKGKVKGRPKGLSFDAKIKAQQALAMYKSNKFFVSEITSKLNISRGTFYKYIKEEVEI